MRTILCAIVIMLILSGCSVKTGETKVKEKSDYSIRYEIDPIRTLIDNENGCQYILMRTGSGSAMTPRMNADGTQMCEVV